jgi:hypothetical protein
MFWKKKRDRKKTPLLTRDDKRKNGALHRLRLIVLTLLSKALCFKC